MPTRPAPHRRVQRRRPHTNRPDLRAVPAGDTSRVTGTSWPERAVCAAVIAVEATAVAALARLVPWRIPVAALGLLVAGWWIEKSRRPAGSRFVVYAAIDPRGVVWYYGKSNGFTQRARQHRADATGGRNRAAAKGKDWARVLVDNDGQLVVVDRARSEHQALRIERRATYTAAAAIFWTHALGVLPPRVFGNRANTHLGRNDRIRTWEWAALPLLLALYTLRPLVDPAWPQWVRWPTDRTPPARKPR